MTFEFDFCSDLHLEFDPRLDGLEEKGFENFFSNQTSDTLIIAGDICPILPHVYIGNKRQADVIKQFHDYVAGRWTNVYCVLGNHDYWYRDLEDAIEIYQHFFDRWTFLDITDQPIVEINDKVTLFGSTLWTYVKPELQLHIQNVMNDYRYIRVGDRMANINDTIAINNETVDRLVGYCMNNCDKDIVVVTHHAPSMRSSVQRYKINYIDVNSGWCNGLESLIASNENIKCWVHGHVHNCCNYEVQQCKVLCNPRGYVGREVLDIDNFQLQNFKI